MEPSWELWQFGGTMRPVTEGDTHFWRPARPENAKPLLWRLRAAWEVIRGRGGVVRWE